MFSTPELEALIAADLEPVWAEMVAKSTSIPAALRVFRVTLTVRQVLFTR